VSSVEYNTMNTSEHPPQTVCRRALASDAPAIAVLAKQLQLQAGDDIDHAVSHGFLVFAKPEEAYQNRFTASRYCIVAEQEGEITGFLVAHDRVELDALGSDLGYMQSLKEYLFGLPYSHWVYIDQIAVSANSQHQGIGQQMHDYLCNQSPKSVIIAGVTHMPVPNERSLGFFTRNGHILKKELQEGEWLCGMYVRETESK
jgi:predicted GNAT superfamily acetyltransferase